MHRNEFETGTYLIEELHEHKSHEEDGKMARRSSTGLVLARAVVFGPIGDLLTAVHIQMSVCEFCVGPNTALVLIGMGF